MKVSRTIGTLALIFLIGLSSGYAQSPFQAGVNFTLAYPLAGFNKNVDGIGLGGTGYFVYKIPRSPLSIGASLGLIVYGSETREEPFSLTVTDVIVDVTTRNYIFQGHFLIRLQPQQGMLRPYLDGLFGFNHIWTQTGVYDQNSYDDEIASSVILSDTVLSYGAGGGLMFRALSIRDSRKKRPFEMYIDMGVRYLKGGKAEYLAESSILLENGDVEYIVNESFTDIMSFHFGLVFVF